MRTIVAGIILSATLALAGCTMTIVPEGAPSASPPATTPTPGSEVDVQPSIATSFVLPDGKRCDWAGEGATLAFDGERLSYTCDGAPEGKTLGLLGEPVQSGPTEWQVVLATVGRNDADTEFVLDSREEMEFTAWWLDLAGGARCLHAGFGATLAFDEGRANYTCDIIAADAMGPTQGDWVILGDLTNAGMGAWLATRGEVVRGDNGFDLVDVQEVPVSTVSGLDTGAPDAAATPEATATPDDSAASSETIDPALLGTTWQWTRTDQPDGAFVEVQDPSRYTLTFMDDGSVGVQFDCNSGGGSYTISGSSLTFGPLITTLMACPGETQADVFGQQLAEVTSYSLEGDTLTLMLAGGGSMTFTPTGTDAMGTEPSSEDAMATSALTGTVWGWTRTAYGDDSVVEAADPSRYTLAFMEGGDVAVQLDCNNGRGTYTQEGSSLTLGPIASTRMACPGDSQADVFARDLENVVSYVIDGEELALSLFADGGIMFFSPLAQ